jgi:cytoskeletal protein CcmA (bactofilin family)
MMLTPVKRNFMSAKDIHPDASKNKITTLLAKSAQFKGDMLLQESVHINGMILGNVIVQGEAMMLSLKDSGRIEGNVQADIVVVAGTIVGNITARLVKLQPTAVVEGEIQYERLLVDDGASINSTRISNVSAPVIESLPGSNE